jgi:predicted DNA-binding transcriptional regulator AlpA
MDGYLTADDLAQRLGIRRATVHRYQARGDLPKPDEHVGRTPLWATTSIDAWEQNRPGRGWRRGKRNPTPDGETP